MKFLIAERISANKYKTPEGYLVCVDSILARTGKQTYRKSEIFADCNDDTEIEVDRKPEEVFSEATLASFENKPITVEHPEEDVNTSNFKDLAVGFVRDIHRGKENGQDVMLGTLVITDEDAIAAVESGEYTDLSCGYDCDINDDDNPQQRNIRGNHIALCEQGRAGIAHIVDSVKDIALPVSIKKSIQRVLAARSTFTRHDLDVSDVVKEIERYCKIDGHPVTLERQNIKGWFKTADGMMRKDYIFTVRGFSNRILISMYADPDTWKTTEVNGYFIDSVNDATMKEYIFKFIPNEFTSKPVEVKFPCLNNELALATLRRSWTWIKMISVTVDGKEVKYQNGKIIDSEETEMKDKLIDIPSNVLSKIESLFKSRNIKITGKGKTWTGRVHYQVEYNGSAKDLAKKLDEIDRICKGLKIPMTYSAGDNGEGFATAGIDFDKQQVADSECEDSKEYRIIVNGVERAKWSAESPEKAVEEFMSFNPMYANHRKGKVEARDMCKDEDLITKAINDEVATIELYNLILTDELDDETRVIIEEIRDDENDHLVKLTKIKNGTIEPDDIIEDNEEEEVKDAMTEFTIRWIDTYKKSRGYSKEEYFHIDKIKAGSLSEALKKLANDVALAGIGTANALIMNARSDKASYTYSGRLSELVRKVKDSSKIDKVISVIKAIKEVK